MALDASTILCMSQYNKSSIYALVDEGNQYSLISITFYQGSSEPSYLSIGTASKQLLGEIRRPLDCYGRSIDSAFFAIMPGTKNYYPNPILNGIRIDFGNATDPTWRLIAVNATYNETTAPTASLLFPYSTYLMHLLDGPSGQTLRAMDRRWTNFSANSMTFVGHTNTTKNNDTGEIFLANTNGNQVRYYRTPSEAYLTNVNISLDIVTQESKVLVGTPYPMSGSECLTGGLAASSITTFYMLCEINGTTSPKQYEVNFYSGNGDFSSGRFGIQGLSGDLLSWNQFLVHENSFRDAAFATLAGNFNESGTVTTKLITRWLGNATVDLALPTPNTPTASPTSSANTINSNGEITGSIITIITGLIALFLIGILYRHGAQSENEENLDGFHKAEDTTHSDGVDSDTGTLVPPGDGLPHLHSKPASSKETSIGHKLDDDKPERSNVLLRSASVLQPTASAPSSSDELESGTPESKLSQPLVSPALILASAPAMEDEPLDYFQFSKHPRPSVTIRME
ncbi:hypothetical protein CPC16_001608 [Podila verticillata]|nr:hypothetical protein CPC16_001608 [Podila verticillata]